MGGKGVVGKWGTGGGWWEEVAVWLISEMVGVPVWWGPVSGDRWLLDGVRRGSFCR